MIINNGDRPICNAIYPFLEPFLRLVCLRLACVGLLTKEY